MNQYFCTKNSPVVGTKQGQLRGFYYDGIYHFLGVKYAKAKRFQMPEEPDSWEGIKDAFAYGYICPVLVQAAPGDERICPHRFWIENENCQNLNVWTDTLDANAKKPVMVWFHGGGYSAGSAVEHIAYEGDRLAKYDGVVTVCVNHRLNAFGHLDLSMFGEKYKNSVNVGIADLVAALKWVKENIAGFGGDPENVTIFGQSGGGGKVTTLGQTPDADGLFQKAIVMSGVFDKTEVEAEDNEVDPKEFALEILGQLNLTEKDVESLEKVPSRLFIRAVNKASRKFELAGKRINWAPHQNYWYLGDPFEVGFRDHYQTIPTMVGSTFGEFYREGDVFDKDELPEAERAAKLKERFGDKAPEVTELFKKAYPGKNELYAIDTDVVCRGASAKYVRLKAETAKAPTYCYMFATCFEFDGGRAPWHCSDIPYFFHNAEVIPYTHSVPYWEALQRQMVASFVNFAKCGDPSNIYSPAWIPSTGKDLYTTVFDEKTEVKKNYDDELIKLVKTMSEPFGFHGVTPDEDEDSDRKWTY